MNERELLAMLKNNPDLQLVTDGMYTTIRGDNRGDSRGDIRGDKGVIKGGYLSEHQLQVAIIQECNRRAATNPVWRRVAAIPNGGQRSKAVAGKLKAEGVRAGIPDLALFLPRHGYHGAFCEIKISPNKPTQAQQEWLHWLAVQGYFVAVVYDDPNEAIDILDWYINGGTS